MLIHIVICLLCVGSRRLVFFNCEIVIEIVGQRGATRSLSQTWPTAMWISCPCNSCPGSRQPCLHEVDKEDKGGIEEDKGG